MKLSDQDLEDLIRACDAAMRTINIFSATFSRWNALQKKAREELTRRKSG